MIKQISSSANPLIKKIRALARKRQRSQSGFFIAEGERLALQAEAAGIRPHYLLFSQETRGQPGTRALVDRMAAAGVLCIETSRQLLSQITRRQNTQDVVAVYQQRHLPLAALDIGAHSLWVALEEVRDPGNLGTILRSADAVGAGGVLLLGDSCDPYSLEAVRASMGSVFTVPFALCRLEELVQWCHAGSGRLIGTSLQSQRQLDAMGMASGRPIVLLMGGEQSGLSKDAMAACHELVRIPMRGAAQSLNLAVATGVMLYSLWGAEGYPGARPCPDAVRAPGDP